MSWKHSINKDTAVWRALTEYVDERIKDLTAVCVAIESTETQIRQAQAAIVELQLLVALPKTIAAEAQMRQIGHRKEY